MMFKGYAQLALQALSCTVVMKMAIFFPVLFTSFSVLTAHPYQRHQRCTHRLENALEHVRRRSAQVKSSRSLLAETPYDLYHSIYGQNSAQEDDFYGDNRGSYVKNTINRNSKNTFLSATVAGAGGGVTAGKGEQFSSVFNKRQPHKLAISRVEVEDLRVKMPQKAAARWVEVDKCNFSTKNSTLDTRLIFPDLTISGKVVLQPSGGKCNMILRLRHAGIEFRTVPIGFDMATNEESRRSGTASVRTDSHFAEPGFISVFAHGCQGPTGIRLRQNSKRRFGFSGSEHSAPVHGLAPDIELSEPQILLGTNGMNRWGKRQGSFSKPFHPLYDIRSEGYLQAHMQEQSSTKWSHKNEPEFDEFYDAAADRNIYRRHFRYKRDTHNPLQPRSQMLYDEMSFNADILNFADDDLQDLVQQDARAFADLLSGNSPSSIGGNVFSAASERDEIDDAFTNELEKLFSMGVRSLLTTYMQRALQPAIKETLMENMGYTLSYG